MQDQFRGYNSDTRDKDANSPDEALTEEASSKVHLNPIYCDLRSMVSSKTRKILAESILHIIIWKWLILLSQVRPSHVTSGNVISDATYILTGEGLY